MKTKNMKENEMSEEVNIYDTANALVRDLSQTSQYQQLKEALAAVKADEEANKIFEEFQDLQQELTQQQLSAQDIDTEVVNRMQDLSQKMTENEKLSRLIQVEQAMNALINDINRIVVAPISKLYE